MTPLEIAKDPWDAANPNNETLKITRKSHLK